MWSSFVILLRRNLSTAVTAVTAVTSPSESSIIKLFLSDLHNERNLDTLIRNFKTASHSHRFRAKHGIYERTVRRLASADRFQSIHEILQYQKQFNDFSKEGFSARIITLYGKSGMFDNAHKLFDEIPQRTVLSLNALFSAYLHSKKFDMVLSLFNTLLVELYAKGRFEDGEKIWNQMEGKSVTPDVKSYNAKLVGMVVVKKTNDAVGLYEKIKNEGVKPNLFSFNALIKGFVNEGDLDEAKKWYSEIASTDFDPNVETFATLLPFLCEKDDLNAAFQVSKDIFNTRCRFGPRGSLLQQVVDVLVSNSMISEAEEIVKLGKASSHFRYKLNLPEG
ncbi:PREDICTED: pentatricopeptide repeat-containing protein At1g55890, mitochondrial-like isoform X2 [Lupinus angustifolius]|uniref:pentatricopeptide repeat-containing protein At1g55890, mitochondrial-like isoform X2 n=1 Tax=Lupinus angustifolius TaxID=3871 RepID=UPI00092F1858|nr:PREDICTED: pentatricopeptide repeat-containing protein At1g55890, mitochondrial-like isoform X2 [Lupinus angustifolius]